jgi:hypothetical protein
MLSSACRQSLHFEGDVCELFLFDKKDGPLSKIFMNPGAQINFGFSGREAVNHGIKKYFQKPLLLAEEV